MLLLASTLPMMVERKAHQHESLIASQITSMVEGSSAGQLDFFLVGSNDFLASTTAMALLLI